MKKSFLFIALFFIVCFSLYAQNESGKRIVNKPAGQQLGIWFDDRYSMFQVQYPIITSIPPLSMNMPYEILLSYVYMDSLMRFTKSYQTDSMIDSWDSLNDTLTNSIKYLYQLVDYNPIIYRQYDNEVTRYRRGLRTTRQRVKFRDSTTIIPGDSTVHRPEIYTNRLIDMCEKLNNKLYKLLPTNEDNRALYSLMEADYILRVRVISKDSTHDKYSKSEPNVFIWEVTAEVLDTIKGRVFKSYDINPHATDRKENNEDIQDVIYINPIIKFEYATQSYWLIDTKLDNGIVYEHADSAFLMNGGFNMEPEQDCIIFLTHLNYLMDSTYDYYELGLEPRCSLNALPILNGQVRDVNNVWSPELYISYNDWKSRVAVLINKILTRTY